VALALGLGLSSRRTLATFVLEEIFSQFVTSPASSDGLVTSVFSDRRES